MVEKKNVIPPAFLVAVTIPMGILRNEKVIGVIHK